MATAMIADERDSASQDGFWETTEFPPAEDADHLPPDNESQDRTDIINPEPGTCHGCGEPVIRQPGQRGRLAKYHPECKPTGKRTAVSSGPRVVRVSKNEQLAAEQTEIVIEQFRNHLRRAVLLLSIVDAYDAMVIQVNAPELLSNLRAILMTYPRARAIALGVGTGGSILGFVMAVGTTVLPIMAHHGLIPVKRVSAFLLNIPAMMLKMQEVASSEDGDEQILFTLRKRLREQAERQQQEEMRRRQEMEAPVSASHTYP